MKRLLLMPLCLFAGCIACGFNSNLCHAQTAQQVQLLQNRIEADEAIIAQDNLDIDTDKKQMNDAIAIKQAEIDSLNTEIQGAKDFLNPTVVEAQPEVISQPIYDVMN